MKTILFLTLALFALAGCGKKKVVRYYYNTVTDTVKVCPPCADTAQCEEKHDCENDKDDD